jgi:small conductance mechanosensitive channel
MQTEQADVIMEWFSGLPVFFLDIFKKVLILIVIYLVGKRVISFVHKRMDTMLSFTKMDKTVKVVLGNVLHVAMYVFLILTMLGAIGYEATSVAAIIASAGLSVGLAFQDTLSNIAGGILLMIAKPFAIGDWVSDGGKDSDTTFEGSVTDIGLAYTTIETLEGKLLVVPNSQLSNGKLANFTRKGKRRLITSVSISYEDDHVKGMEVFERVVRSFPEVLQDEPLEVFVDDLGDSGVKLQAWYWVKSADFIILRHGIMGRLKTELEAAGLHIPYPQVDVHMKAKGAAYDKVVNSALQSAVEEDK